MAAARNSQKTPEQKKRRAEAERARRKANPEKNREAVARWRKRNPEWQARDDEKRKARLATPEGRERARAAHRRWKAKNKIGGQTTAVIGEALQAALGKNTLYASAKAAVPSSYPPYIRDDIISAIVLAVLEGEISEQAIKANAKRFEAAYWRERDLIGTLSLDAPIPGYDSMTYLDRLTAPEI